MQRRRDRVSVGRLRLRSGARKSWVSRALRAIEVVLQPERGRNRLTRRARKELRDPGELLSESSGVRWRTAPLHPQPPKNQSLGSASILYCARTFRGPPAVLRGLRVNQLKRSAETLYSIPSSGAGAGSRAHPATSRIGDEAARGLHVFRSKRATKRCREGVAVAAIRQSGRRTLTAA